MWGRGGGGGGGWEACNVTPLGVPHHKLPTYVLHASTQHSISMDLVEVEGDSN